MKQTSQATLLDRFASDPAAEEGAALGDGDRIAVIGGGPAGSFFSFFLLQLADTIDLDVAVDIYEPRRFTHTGPAGCNHCGGIVSESLVQILAAEGINLPPGVVQRGIDSYVVHMDVGSVRIESSRQEQRIAALHRGNGPRGAVDMPWRSFDGYVLRMAQGKGARLVPELVTGLEWSEGRPVVVQATGERQSYDLVALASGVNSNLVSILDQRGATSGVPQTTRTYICELQSDQDSIRRVLGNSMHVFLLDIPRLEFAALIPKGDFVTLVMLGDEIDDALIDEFLMAPEVRRCFPTDTTPRVCHCSPLINMDPAERPFGDRVVFVGDCGVTRLYKDGIGAAYRTAKAAAETAVLFGVGADDFEKHYAPICRSIDTDNRIGKLIFGMTTLFKTFRFARRAVLRMAAREQRRRRRRRPMSGVLWNLFTGSAPYREILRDSVHPTFITHFAWNLLAGNVPGRRNGAGSGG